jgi:hypothetical protein
MPPEDALQPATPDNDLGPLVSTHRTSLAVLLSRLTGGVMLLLPGLWILSLPQPGWWILAWVAYLLSLGPVGLVLLLFGAFAIIHVVTRIGVAINLHRDGIVFWRLNRRITCRWESISRVFRRNLSRVPGRRSSLRDLLSCVSSFDVHLDNKWFGIDSNVSHFDVLWRAIEEQATGLLLPKANDAYSKGETLDFGRIALSSSGIWRCGGTPVPWHEIEVITIDDSLEAKIHDRPVRLWIECSVSKVANVLVLTRLLKTLGVCRLVDRLDMPSDGAA